MEVEPGLYEPHQVVLGRQLDGVVEVRKGLKEGEKVVIKGQFMLDSESRLKEALQQFKPPQEDEDGVETAADGGSGGTKASALERLEKLEADGCTYTCPMEEHWDVCGHEPGRCPKCNMKLQPIEKLKAEHGGGEHGHGAHAGAGGGDAPKTAADKLKALQDKGCTYTCSMEEDWDVCAHEPGKCPKCGMKLQPIEKLLQRLDEEDQP